ncbi:hypothetical protein ACFL34_00045 [Candidatus Sumerlaeota bacterium]
MRDDVNVLRKRIRLLLLLFMAGLLLSGLTAFPLEAELSLLQRAIGQGTALGDAWPGIAHWVSYVHRGAAEIGAKYPFLWYGTDWLAFAHIVIAIAFIGPLRDPVKNIWVVEFGMIACVLVIPLALICGPIRGIPFFWQLIDCSFGIFGIIPLWLARRYIVRIIKLERKANGGEPAGA